MGLGAGAYMAFGNVLKPFAAESIAPKRTV